MQIKYYDPVTFNPRKQPTFHIGNVFIIVEQISRRKNHPKNRIILLNAKDTAWKEFWGN